MCVFSVSTILSGFVASFSVVVSVFVVWLFRYSAAIVAMVVCVVVYNMSLY